MKPINLSKAKTAWGLCNAVIRAVKNEPWRMNMEYIVALVGKGEVNENIFGMPDAFRPACGTVGCLAGWVSILAVGRMAAARLHSTQHAQRVLGRGLKYSFQYRNGKYTFLSAAQARQLRIRGSYLEYVFNSGEGDTCNDSQGGTPEHAAAVVKRLRAFMRANEAKLRARVLTARIRKNLTPRESL